MREGEAPSFFNPIEASALVDLLAGLLAYKPVPGRPPAVKMDDIGVIATYRKQVRSDMFVTRMMPVSNCATWSRLKPVQIFDRADSGSEKHL